MKSITGEKDLRITEKLTKHPIVLNGAFRMRVHFISYRADILGVQTTTNKRCSRNKSQNFLTPYDFHPHSYLALCDLCFRGTSTRYFLSSSVATPCEVAQDWDVMPEKITWQESIFCSYFGTEIKWFRTWRHRFALHDLYCTDLSPSLVQML